MDRAAARRCADLAVGGQAHGQAATGLVVVPPEREDLTIHFNRLLDVERSACREATGSEPPGDGDAGSRLLDAFGWTDARGRVRVGQVVDGVDVMPQEDGVTG